VTEADVRAAAGGARTLTLPPGAVVTPAARDLARQLGVALVADAQTRTRADAQSEAAPRDGAPARLRGPVVAIGADHGGFPLKESLKQALAELGCEVLDVGTHSTDAVDYPDFAVAVARAVAEGRARLGIMVDGAGIGSAMAANKIPGVRAALVHDAFTAQAARAHNDANIVAFGARVVGPGVAEQSLRVFRDTPFEGGRHARRVEKITALERGK
jgi:ribose 5-phosphate isomerase B